MQLFAAKLHRLLVSEDGLSTATYTLMWMLTAAMGYIAYLMLRNGLF